MRFMEIYLGARLDYASERVLLQHIARIVAETAADAIVLANVNLGGRQIDFVLCLEKRTIVLEAKGYTRPVRGGRNGLWEVQWAASAWKATDNAYRQALDAKNALRDEMRAFAPSREPPYPSAAVVFVPAIPVDSELESGDFKVSIIGLQGLDDAIRRAPPNSWHLDQWRAFAQSHRLPRVGTIETACNQGMWADERLLASYLDEFSRTYNPGAEHLVPFTCKSKDGDDVTSDDVVREITDGNTQMLLCGASGCGKSLLALRTGISALSTAGVPIVFAAKHYETRIKVVLDREIGLLAPCSAVQLMAAARRQGRRILLIVDGYNECREDRREALTRCIAALGKRFECSLLVTSRFALALGNLMPLRQIDVFPPNTDVKRAIALQGRQGQSLSAHLELLIEAVTSGLEARLIGEVGQNLSAQASRHNVFDAFTRSRLGGAASDGIQALARIAHWLYEHVTFSVSVRDLDRLAQADDISTATLTELVNKGLLSSRADRVSFSHELFFHAFAAEAVIRCSEGDVGAIIKALNDPRHTDRRDLIVGAMEDLGALSRVLEQTPDASLVASCVSGACGRFAREWIAARYPAVLSHMREEVNGVQCALTTDSAWGVSITSDNPISREPPDRALVQYLPELISQGIYLNEVLELALTLDQNLSHECSRLREQARQQRVGLKSSVFAEAYGLASSKSLALTRVCTRLHGELFGVKSSLVQQIGRLAASENLTSGQLYMLMSLCRHVEDAAGTSALGQIVIDAIEQHGQRAPYHLQLALVDAARHCDVSTTAAERQRLIEALKSMLDDRNIGVNTAVFEVLQQLNAFECESLNMEPQIRQTIDGLVNKAGDPECCAEADRIYNSQFDGPYSDAYWEVVNGLPDSQRKTFLEMASSGAEYASHFLSILLIDLAAFNDPRTEAAFHRWTRAPQSNSFMPQMATEAFVLAHVALARLRVDLSPYEPYEVNGPADCALHACGRLLYWANRLDVAHEVVDRATKKTWAILDSDGPKDYALNVVSSCCHTLITSTDKLPGGRTAQISILDLYPTQTAAICRRSLVDPEALRGYFQFYREHDRLQDQMFALSALGKHGQSVDLPLLRRIALSADLGREALKAIYSLEQRLVSSEHTRNTSTS
jgi:hypothetical protein